MRSAFSAMTSLQFCPCPSQPRCIVSRDFAIRWHQQTANPQLCWLTEAGQVHLSHLVFLVCFSQHAFAVLSPGWGMAIFMVSSVGCGFANSFWTLLACRIVMGAGEASIINLTGTLPQDVPEYCIFIVCYVNS